jgi:hypothetical protein
MSLNNLVSNLFPKMTPRERLKKAFEIAEKVLKVPSIMDDEDIENLVAGTANVQCWELYLSVVSRAMKVLRDYTVF